MLDSTLTDDKDENVCDVHDRGENGGVSMLRLTVMPPPFLGQQSTPEIPPQEPV